MKINEAAQTGFGVVFGGCGGCLAFCLFLIIALIGLSTLTGGK